MKIENIINYSFCHPPWQLLQLFQRLSPVSLCPYLVATYSLLSQWGCPACERHKSSERCGPALQSSRPSNAFVIRRSHRVWRRRLKAWIDLTLFSGDQGRISARTESGSFSSWICCSFATQRNILPGETPGFSYSIHHQGGWRKKIPDWRHDSCSWVWKNALWFGNIRIWLHVEQAVTGLRAGTEDWGSSLGHLLHYVNNRKAHNRSPTVFTSHLFLFMQVCLIPPLRSKHVAYRPSPIKFHQCCDMSHWLNCGWVNVITPRLMMQPVWSTVLLEEICFSSRFTVLHHLGSQKVSFSITHNLWVHASWSYVYNSFAHDHFVYHFEMTKISKVSVADRPGPSRTVMRTKRFFKIGSF